MDPSRRASRAIVDAVADAEASAVSDLDPRLHDVLDSEALNMLFRSSSNADVDRELRLTFRYLGYQIEVTEDHHTGVAVEVTAVEETS